MFTCVYMHFCCRQKCSNAPDALNGGLKYLLKGPTKQWWGLNQRPLDYLLTMGGYSLLWIYFDVYTAVAVAQWLGHKTTNRKYFTNARLPLLGPGARPLAINCSDCGCDESIRNGFTTDEAAAEIVKIKA